MVKGLYTAYTGMINEQHRMDTLTNNLANADTNGYKKEGATSQAFDDVLAIKIKDASYGNRKLKQNIGIGNFGVKIGENYTDYSQGAFKVTGNTYDIALSGEGFFNIEFTNKGGTTSTKYTRDGAFVVNTEGYLVTKDGDFVLGQNGKIQLDPTKEVVVDTMGNISQEGARVDKIKLTDFEDYNYLEHYGENFYQPVDGATEKAATATVNQGYIETSNVQVVSEMVEMISVSRQYESNQRLITTFDSTLEIAANQLGKV